MEEHVSTVCLTVEQWNRILSRLLKQSLPPDTLVTVAIDYAEEKAFVTVVMEE